MFFKKLLHLPKTFLWKGRLNLWQCRQKCLAESPNFFCWNFENDKKLILPQLIFLFKTFIRGRRFQGSQRYRNFLPKTQIFFGETPKLTKIQQFLPTKIFSFSPKFSLGTQIAVLITIPKKFSYKWNKSSLKVNKRWKKLFLKSSQLNISSGHVFVSFENPTERKMHIL